MDILLRRLPKLARAAPFMVVFLCLKGAYAPHLSASAAQNTATPGCRNNLRELIPDVVVQDQDGRSVRVYSDLLKGKVFVINFIYVACQGTCLVLGKNFATLQRMLSDQDRKEVQLISISLDPTNDSPQKLKALGKSFRAKAGWTFVTGEKASMQKLLRALIGDLPRKGEHSDAILIGDEAGCVLERQWGLAPAARLTQAIKEMLTTLRARRSAKHHHSSRPQRNRHEKNKIRSTMAQWASPQWLALCHGEFALPGRRGRCITRRVY